MNREDVLHRLIDAVAGRRNVTDAEADDLHAAVSPPPEPAPEPVPETPTPPEPAPVAAPEVGGTESQPEVVT